MSERIKSLVQLSDSRLLFEKKVPAFGYIITVVVMVMMVGVMIWSMFTPKTYIIKSQGTVTSSNSNYIMPAFSGEITETFMEVGRLVEQGDTLFTIKATDYNIQEEQLVNNKKAYEDKIEKYELLVKSIKDDKNYFDALDSDDELYYSTYEAYKAKVDQNQLDASAYKAYGYSEEQIESKLLKNEGKI